MNDTPSPRPKETLVTSDAPVTFLTQEAYDRLAAELEQLSTTGREEIAKRIEAAREEGDLKENGGYHAAKDEQGKQEARIRSSAAPPEERDGRRGAGEHGRRRARHRRHGRSSPATRRPSCSATARSPATPSSTSTASAVAARRGDPRAQGRREDDVHGAQRTRDRGRGHRGRDLRGSVTRLRYAAVRMRGARSVRHDRPGA